MRAAAIPPFRWIAAAFVILAVPLMILAAARYQRAVVAAQRTEAMRRAAAQLQALEERVILHPADADALAALVQAYEASRRTREAAALRSRLLAPGSWLLAPRPLAPSPPRPLAPSQKSPRRPVAPSPPQASPLASLIERAAREPGNLALQREVVARCQEQEWLPAAIPALRRLARAAPAEAATWRRLGVAELQAGRLEAARDALRVAVERNPQDAVAHFFLGLAHSGRAEVPQALAAFAKVQALRPDYTPAALERIRLQIEDWRLAGAVAEARRLVQRRPRLAEAHYQLGVALYHLHDLEGAEEALRNAVRLDPGPARHHAWLGMTLLERGRLPEAVASLEAAVARSPEYTNALYQLGRARLLQGRLDEAERALRQTLVFSPRDPQACFKLSQIYSRRGRRDEAAILLARFQSLSEFEQRRNYIERHAQAQPQRPEWRRRLGDLYAREGLMREARAQYERAAELQAAHARR